MSLLIPIVGAILGPLLWLVPPTVAAIRHPDMAAKFPLLKIPEEAAFLQTAADVLPQGMLGLLVCGILAATLTSMDAGLNQGAGIFVRNFYLPVLNPRCPERRLLILSKVATAVLGAIMIGLGLMWEHVREANLFDLVNQVAVSVSLPISIPLFLGLVHRRTPPWSAWSTVLIGFTVSIGMNTLVRDAEGWTSLAHFQWILGLQGASTPEEATQFALFATVFLVSTVCVGWFYLTSIFYDRTSDQYRANLEEFFGRLETPLQSRRLDAVGEDRAFVPSIVKLLVIYGGFVCLLSLIPNPPGGRACFLLCGGVMVISGLGILLGRPALKVSGTSGPAAPRNGT
jgi:Na+/proline symporter